MKKKSLTFLLVILMSVFSCSKNEPGSANDVQRAPASTEPTYQPIDKKGMIYLAPAENPGDRCRDSIESITCM